MCLFSSQSAAGAWSGYLSTEFRGFIHGPNDPRQHQNDFSLAAEPVYYTDWNEGRQSFAFVPFARIEQYDKRRTHVDIRELTWLMVGKQWELRIGIRKVFWGVTESQHLVDIINQTDLVENPEGEEKLGQPMINVALIRKWGALDFFIMPYFRERTFPGVEGRLRTFPRVDSSQSQYESSRKENHIDYAIRWSYFIGDWDIGISHFNGTSRDPSFKLGVDNGESVLIPFYYLIRQTSVDIQATKGAWLWKLEAIRRSGQGETYYAATGGLEYTFFEIFVSDINLGLVLEYMYDDRGKKATTPFEDDTFLGFRFAFNDEQSTEALIGSIVDKNNR